MDIKPLSVLVFGGGGVRGFAYVGALMAFHDTFKVSAAEHFKTFAGTSVGALFALVSALGLQIADCVSVFETVGLERIFSKDPSCLLSSYALNNGQALEGLVLQLLALKDLGPSSTLKDLFTLTQKTLVIAAIDLLTSDMLYLDHTNIGCDMPIVKAIMGSMALPPLFPPVAFSKGRKKILLSDGGLLESSPFARFNPADSLLINSTWYIDKSPIKDIASYYTRILHIMLLGTHDVQEREIRAYCTILIDLGSLSVDDTGINVKELIFAGYRAAIGRFTLTGNAEQTYDPAKFIQDDMAYLSRPSYLNIKKL